jgi:ADP-heptose:LPS heptosyltransferase
MVSIKSADRILIIRLSAVGDVINTIPALSALRKAFPKSYIAWVVEDKAKDIIEDNPDLDDIFIFKKKLWWQNYKMLRSKRFDVVLDFQGNLKGAFHCIISGARIRIGFARGFCKELNYLFSNIHIKPDGFRINRVKKYLSLLRPLGITNPKVEYKVIILPETKEKIENFLLFNKYEKGKYVAIHPGTSRHGVLKRWSLDKYSKLAELVMQKLGLGVLLTWGPDERKLVEAITFRMQAKPLISSKTSLKELAVLIKNACCFVGSDSGPLHLANAIGVPCVGLYGPKDPSIYAPYGKGHRIIYKDMDKITVDEVFREIESLVRTHPKIDFLGEERQNQER